MILTVDSKRRVTLPKSAHPGDAFAVEAMGEAQFVLTRLQKPSTKVRLSRKGGFLLASSGRPISMAQTRALLEQFP